MLRIKIKHNGPICMVGDFNARSGNLPDQYAQDDIVIHDVPKPNM